MVCPVPAVEKSGGLKVKFVEALKTETPGL